MLTSTINDTAELGYNLVEATLSVLKCRLNRGDPGGRKSIKQKRKKIINGRSVLNVSHENAGDESIKTDIRVWCPR